MDSLGWIIGAMVLVYIAACFGKIAAKHGKNPILYGILSVVSPANLIIPGYWAFSDFETKKDRFQRTGLDDNEDLKKYPRCR
jgi:hypothetical protein